MTLRGPAAPDEFRVQVGRYGDRWYHDPLPADDTWPLCSDTWPSVTTIKKASDRDWSWVSLERAASYLADRRGELDGMNAAEIHARLLEVNKAGLGRAASRGSDIHRIVEDLAAGQQMMTALVPEAEPYIPAVQAFINEMRPEWLLSEVVAISRTHGYAGTLDGVIAIGGNAYLVDYKTRKAGKHGAHLEEGWQLAAYARADYIIVNDGGMAVRKPMPHLDGALIISIEPGGYRTYPVDLDEAWEGFRTLRRLWADKQRSVIGKPVRLEPLPTPQPAATDRRQRTVKRIERLRDEHPELLKTLAARWPSGVPTIKQSDAHTDEQLDAIDGVLTRIEADGGVPFASIDSVPEAAPVAAVELPAAVAAAVEAERLPAPPDEGADVAVDDIRTAMRAIGKEREQWIARISKAAKEAGAGISLLRPHGRPSMRRWAIADALIRWSAIAPADDQFRNALALAVAADWPQQPAFTVGQIVGALSTPEATALANLADAVTRKATSLDDIAAAAA